MFFQLALRFLTHRYEVNEYLEKRNAARFQRRTTPGEALTPAPTSERGETVAPSAEDEIDALYGILNIIDGKASALMTFDSILVAAASVSLSQPIETSVSLSNGLVAISGALSLLSVIVSLAAVAIDWPFLGKVSKSEDGYVFEKEIDSLKKVMMFRQDSYRVAWWLALVSVGFFLTAYAAYLCDLVF